jgi:hypothetical protein
VNVASGEPVRIGAIATIAARPDLQAVPTKSSTEPQVLLANITKL